MKLVEARHQLEILLRRLLGEAEAGIEHDLRSSATPAASRDLQRAPQETNWSSITSGSFSRSRPVCMMTSPAPVSAATAAMPGSRCRPQTSLTICAPAATRQPRGFGAIGVDRDQHAAPARQRLDHGQHARLLLRRR